VPNIVRVQPSFLLIVIDCLRADTVARPRREWPEIGRLIGDGASFATAYTTCPTTSPAFTSMLTGRYPAAHGVRALRGAALPDSVPSVAEELAKGGYRTWCSVTGPLLDSVGLFRGFEEADYRDIPRRSVHTGWGDEALAKVGELAAGDEPFFALVHVWDVHTPRKYPRSFDRRRYGRNAYERSLAGIDAWVGRMREAAGDALVLLTGDHGENLFLEPRGLRWQGLARRITPRLPIQKWSLKLLERGVRSDSKRLLKLAPRYFWNHNQTLLEPLVRVPLALAGPGTATGVRRGVVSHVDLAPTLLDLAGLPEPIPGWQGTSLAASVRDGAEPPAHPVAMEVGVTPGVPTVPQHAIREGSWKLITSLSDERVADALYDLEADPRERRNLARERPEEAHRLRVRLEELATESVEAAPMAEEDEAILAARLEELGYL
jgi:arylsulfatase A-like enzyme